MSLAPYLDTHKAIIGTSGAGKSTTAREEVEQLLNDNRHVCIIDPTGVWWGLRSAADGESPGFDIAVFGGDHGDVPISAGQGGIVGKIIAGGVSAVVDVSDMSSADQRFFVLEMLAAIRKHRERGNFHLIVDEADEFAAQTSRDSIGFQCEEALVWTAKRGRFFGYVLTIITQRTADMSWSVLSQCVTMVVHHLMAPQDIAVVDKYLKANADKETRLKVLSSIPNLQTGQRWIYSPKLKVLEEGMTPLPITFDSSATPAAGESVIEPKKLAEIDLGEIRELLAPPKPEPEEERAETINPGGELHDEINTLREALRNAESARDFWKGDRDIWKEKSETWKSIAHHRGYVMADIRKSLVEDGSVYSLPQLKLLGLLSPEQAEDLAEMEAEEALEEVVVESYPVVPPSMPRPLPMDELAKRQGLGGTDVAPRWIEILDALAWAQLLLKMDAVDRAVVAWIKGCSPKSSGFENDLGAMRSRGLITYPSGGTVALTDVGRSFSKPPKMPPAADQLRKVVKAAMDLQSPKIFEALEQHVPKKEIFGMVTSWLEPRHAALLEAVKGYQLASRETIAEFLGKSPKSSGFENDLGKLRTLGLLDYPKPGYVSLGRILA